MRPTCAVCGPARVRLWRIGWPYRVLRCRNCGLGLTWPIPTDEELSRGYSEGYYERDGMGRDAAAGWPARAEEILALLPEPVGRALDVGAGQGHLVAALRARGMEAEGLEPLESGRREALALHGVELQAEWPDPSARRFDLITMIHSLEHVRDPRVVLERAAALVRPGGFLFVDVPHAGTMDLWLPGRRRSILALPVHLHHFTPEPLCRLLQLSGWAVTAVHLVNPELLERFFRLRAQLARRAPASGSGQRLDESPPARAGRGGIRRRWREILLPWIRRRYPGWRLMVVGERAGDVPGGGAAALKGGPGRPPRPPPAPARRTGG